MYILFVFLLLPLLFLALSIAGLIYVIVFASILLAFILFVTIINILQNKCPKCLPKCLKTWDCLPLPCRSLKPWNDCFLKCKCCQKLQEKNLEAEKQKKTETSPINVGRHASNISLDSFSIRPDSEKNAPNGTGSGDRKTSKKDSIKPEQEKILPTKGEKKDGVKSEDTKK